MPLHPKQIIQEIDGKVLEQMESSASSSPYPNK